MPNTTFRATFLIVKKASFKAITMTNTDIIASVIGAANNGASNTFILSFHLLAVYNGTAQGQFIGIFDISTYRNTAGNTRQGSCADRLKQIEQWRVAPLASTMVLTNRSTSSCGISTRWYAKRRADFDPMPGNLRNCSTSRSNAFVI